MPVIQQIKKEGAMVRYDAIIIGFADGHDDPKESKITNADYEKLPKDGKVGDVVQGAEKKITWVVLIDIRAYRSGY